MYELTDTNGLAMLSLNELLLPGPSGLQGLHPGPAAGDTGQYANLRFYWKLENRYGVVVPRVFLITYAIFRTFKKAVFR